MAKHLVLVKERGGFYPADPYTAEIMDTIPEDGKRFAVDLKEDRSKGELAFYWAGIGLLVNNFTDEAREKWPNSERFSKALLEATGHSTRWWRLDGTYTDRADSIALNKMEAAEFETYFETARAMVVSMFGYDPWDLWAQEKDNKRWRRMQAQRNWWPGATDEL